MPTPVPPAGTAPVDPHWHDREPEPIPILHRDWTLVLRGDSMDDIGFAGTQIFRAVRFVVRDHDWRTVSSVVDRIDITAGADATIVRLEAHTDDADVRLEWSGELRLSDRRLRFEATGIPRNSFHRNRIGIVVLHPPSLAGRPLTVRSVSGDLVATAFPSLIAPHQPAVDVSGFDWEAGEVAARLTLFGDVFETEDQRNWTDASFKTYSTPLSRPFPVAVTPDTRIVQAVELTCTRNTATGSAHAPPGPSTLVAHRTGHPFPDLAVGASTAPAAPAMTPPKLGGVPVLVELDLAAGNWRAALDRADRDGGGAPLDVRLITGDPALLDDALHEIGPRSVQRIGVFHPRTHLSDLTLSTVLRTAMDRAGMTAERVGGTRAHFAELNRNLERLESTDAALTFSITPQMHDRSRQQLIESVAIQRLVAEQAVAMAAGRRVHIGPVTLRPRFNAVSTSRRTPDQATDVVQGYGAEQVRDSTDPRQDSAALAGWLVASAAALAIDGVASLTYFEAWGPRGLRSGTGTDYPAAETFEWLLNLPGSQRCQLSPESASTAPVLVARSRDALTVIAANLETAPKVVLVDLSEVVGTAGLAPPEVESRHGARASIEGSTLTVTVPPGAVLRWRSAILATETD
jgi:hypothetical protein